MNQVQDIQSLFKLMTFMTASVEDVELKSPKLSLHIYVSRSVSNIPSLG
jgi:hypothetical protein